MTNKMLSVYRTLQTVISNRFLLLFKICFTYNSMLTLLLVGAAYSARSLMSVWVLSFLLILVINFRRRSGSDTFPGFCMTQTLAYFYFLFKSNALTRRRLILQHVFSTCACFMREGIFSLSCGIGRVLFLKNPDVIQAVLSSSDFLRKGYEYNMLRPLLKDGVATSTGKKWQARRKLLTAAFHFKIIDEFIPIYDKQAKILVKGFDERMRDQKSIDIVPLIALCSLDIVLETTLGKNVSAQESPEHVYAEALRSASKIIAHRTTSPWLWLDFIFFRTENGKKLSKYCGVMETFTREVIYERKRNFPEKLKSIEKLVMDPEDKAIDRKVKQRFALLDLLLYAHLKDNMLSLEDVAEEVGTFIPAGQGTISQGMSWTLYLLGLNHGIQRKVQEEVDTVLGKDVDRIITPEDVKKFKFLDCVLKEALRLYPPFPLVSRFVNKDTVIKGYKICKGTPLIVPIYMLHRNPEVFPNPEEFNPERFNPENSKGRHPFAYIPFAAGPRNCIAKRFAINEALTVLAIVLRHFNITSMEPRDKILLSFDVGLVSEKGIHLKLTKRRF